MGTKRQDKEEKVESAFTELCKKHNEKYTTPQLKLWARMIVNGLHENYDCPPNVPMITDSVPKVQKNEPLSQVIASAATAFFHRSSQYGCTKSPISDMQDIWNFLHPSQ